MIFHFKIGQFPFHTLTNSVSHFNKFRLTANFYRFRCLFAIFHTKIMLVIHDMGLSSILLSVELLLTQETRFSTPFSHWKFCFKPQIPLRFPVKTENHWVYLCYNFNNFSKLQFTDVLLNLYFSGIPGCVVKGVVSNPLFQIFLDPALAICTAVRLKMFLHQPVNTSISQVWA